MNLLCTFCRCARLVRAGKMPRSLTRVEDWARAETFAKRTSFHYRISAEPEQRAATASPFCRGFFIGKTRAHGIPQTGTVAASFSMSGGSVSHISDLNCWPKNKVACVSLLEENSRLKRLVADLTLDKAMLQGVLSKKV